MAENYISEHEVRIYEAVRLDGGWLTAREIAAKADVADRTARAHAGNLANHIRDNAEGAITSLRDSRLVRKFRC